MKTTLDFLRKLSRNNNREWFEKNKSQFEASKKEIKSLTENFIRDFAKHDPGIAGLTARDCMFRIYRDVRFSKNKSPYKTNLGAYFSPGGKKSNLAGYYIHIEPGASFIAGGMWMPEAEELRKIRQEIDYNGNELKKILNNKSFKTVFGGLDTEHKLKNNPKGYAKDHPDIELLKLTSFICWHGFTDEEVLSENFQKALIKSAKLMIPLNNFLNVAVSD